MWLKIWTHKCFFSKYGHPLMTYSNRWQQRCILVHWLIFTKRVFNTIRVFKDLSCPISHKYTVTIRPASIFPLELLFIFTQDWRLDFVWPAKRRVTQTKNSKIWAYYFSAFTKLSGISNDLHIIRFWICNALLEGFDLDVAVLVTGLQCLHSGILCLYSMKKLNL